MKINFFAIIALSSLIFFGCEDSSSGGAYFGANGSTSGSSVKNSSIVGTWCLTDSDNNSWYIHFQGDGSWRITDDAAGNAQRVYGAYTTSGSSYSGNMTNPGVGTGQISGSISGNTISLDFCEHWHTPHKHVMYSGTKM